jgi:hypothetical protein
MIVLDYKKGFLCILTESEISHRSRGTVTLKEWHPVHAAEEPEVRTLVGTHRHRGQFRRRNLHR